MAEMSTYITASVPVRLKELVEKRAKKEDTSQGEVVRKALEDYFSTESTTKPKKALSEKDENKEIQKMSVKELLGMDKNRI